MHELVIQVIFYIFAALALGSALLVISQNNPVRCVLFLVLTFFFSAGLWILANAEFLALILVLVYVGAVMTLFLFVVMMLNIDSESIKTHMMRYLPFGLILVALLTSLLITAIPKGTFENKAQTNNEQVQTQENNTITVVNTKKTNPELSNTEALGMVLYTDYLLAFELAAVILLVAIVAAITLVHRGAVRSKRQNIKEQLMIRSQDRVRLVTMKTEK